MFVVSRRLATISKISAYCIKNIFIYGTPSNSLNYARLCSVPNFSVSSRRNIIKRVTTNHVMNMSSGNNGDNDIEIINVKGSNKRKHSEQKTSRRKSKKAKVSEVRECKKIKKRKTKKRRSHKKHKSRRQHKTASLNNVNCITLSDDSDVEIIFVGDKNKSTSDSPKTEITEAPSSSYVLSSNCTENANDASDSESCAADCGSREENTDTKNAKKTQIVKSLLTTDYESGFWERRNILESLASSMEESVYAEAATMRRYLDEKRRWEFTEYALKDKYQMGFNLPCLPFKLLSYNVLSQKLMINHPYLYKYHDTRALDWDFRSRLLYAELLMYNADIICIQELQADYLQIFSKEMATLGYAGIYKQRTHGKVDGVAIFYKTRTFQLVEHTSIEFNQPGVRVLNRDNVGLVAKLSVKDYPEDQVVVATTHLLFNPNRHDVKLAQMQLLLSEVERFAYHKTRNGGTYYPVIVTGDMNFSPQATLYTFMTTGKLKYEKLSSQRLKADEGSPLGKIILPEDLKITDSCQHWGVLTSRRKGEVFENHLQERKVVELFNSDYSKDRKKETRPPSFAEFVENIRKQGSVNDFSTVASASTSKPESDSESNENEMPPEMFGTGTLTMPFKLVSANNQTDGVTTYQNEWVCVDHIFYSDCKKEGLPVTGDLNLLGQMRLLSKAEAWEFKVIPNFISPSDHYPLMAAFELCLRNSS